MSDRNREVVSEFSTYYVCDVHGWDFTNVDEDVCPVCLGESLERERIIKLFEETEKHNYLLLGDNNGVERKHLPSCDLCKRIALIKGENK